MIQRIWNYEMLENYLFSDKSENSFDRIDCFVGYELLFAVRSYLFVMCLSLASIQTLELRN